MSDDVMVNWLEGLVVSSHERRYISFKLLESLLPTLVANEVGVVFSPNLMGCLMNNARSSGNYLYPKARHLVSCLAAADLSSMFCRMFGMSGHFPKQLEELYSCLETTTDQGLLTTILIHFQRR